VGDFAGLQIGLSSLLAQRRAIEVTGHNLASVGTEGYSRQRVELASDAGPITPALFARYEGAGMGVRSDTITRLRDQFLELQGYREHAADSRLGQLRTTFERVESAFGEPSDTGLAAQLADFWAGWDDIANRPDDIAARSQLLERAATLASSFRRLDDQFATMRDATIDQLSAGIAEVNALAGRIAELNATIQSATASGLNANDLMDQRDVLVSHLAERVGATIRPNDGGTVDVFVGGTALVRGPVAESLEVVVGSDPAQTVSVQWVKDGLPAAVDGAAAGMLQTVNGVLPQYRSSLAAVADELRLETNAVHTTGFDLDGNAGVDVFVVGVDGLIEVNPALAGQPRMLAAAASPGTLDGSIAASLAGSGNADRAYRQLVVGLGVEAQSANRRADIQANITKQVDAAREAGAGVNIDEEMTNLIAYQHAYDAAARFVTAVDQALDTLINGTGRVGR
jgi:flagellar hook-associated protein 1 FlgK